ncbi:LemA family protein [Virgibacillus sp. YIM 98842]|jgi:LemA protein|uniref:LemA family protein n=1 Tax=Virgibacillus sp. YIM 98842 TaxID=2663533 RepID=UPI0013DBF104|nr:LemA family protein [Virgibacillus sp. YIM 98842]
MGMFVAIGIAAVLALFFVISYNQMKKQAVNVENAFGDLDAFLMKRVDQLDNLIQTARVATDKEIEGYEKIIGLREGIVGAHNMDEKLKAHINMQREIPMAMARIERYPELKFNENYLHIQRSINDIEEQIQAARRNFNSHTGKYNQLIATFPRNLIAGIFGFTSKPMFETPPEKRENVDVKALFNR